jgi:hypothetical protein
LIAVPSRRRGHYWQAAAAFQRRQFKRFTSNGLSAAPYDQLTGSKGGCGDGTTWLWEGMAAGQGPAVTTTSPYMPWTPM